MCTTLPAAEHLERLRPRSRRQPQDDVAVALAGAAQRLLSQAPPGCDRADGATLHHRLLTRAHADSGLIPRSVRMPPVERRVAAVTPRATPIAGWAAISPLPPIISTRIGTTPIQMARPARSPVSVGAAPVGDLNDHWPRSSPQLARGFFVVRCREGR